MSELILAFETCTTGCSVAVADMQHVLAQETDPRPNYQARLLLPMIESALRHAGLDYGDLTVLTTTTGPGSFTGIRIGIAAARGLLLAQPSLKAVGVNTMETLAWSAIRQQVVKASSILSLWNASRGQAYEQRFAVTPFAALTPPRLTDVAQIDFKDSHIIGNMQDYTATLTVPHALDLITKVQHQGATHNPQAFAPLYIRDADAKLPV